MIRQISRDHEKLYDLIRNGGEALGWAKVYVDGRIDKTKRRVIVDRIDDGEEEYWSICVPSIVSECELLDHQEEFLKVCREIELEWTDHSFSDEIERELWECRCNNCNHTMTWDAARRISFDKEDDHENECEKCGDTNLMERLPMEVEDVRALFLRITDMRTLERERTS